MSMDSLKDLYIDELKDLYNAETQLIKALPKMAKKATAPELKQAFQDHLEETKGHVERLEQIAQDERDARFTDAGIEVVHMLTDHEPSAEIISFQQAQEKSALRRGER